MIPPSARRQFSSSVSFVSSFTKSSVLFSGRALWVISTTAFLLGVPWALAYAEEEQYVQLEREQGMIRGANEVCFRYFWGSVLSREMSGNVLTGSLFRCSLPVNSKPRKLNLLCKRSGPEMKVESGGETSHVPPLHGNVMIQLEETKNEEEKKATPAWIRFGSLRFHGMGCTKARFPFLNSNMGSGPTVLRHLVHVSV